MQSGKNFLESLDYFVFVFFFYFTNEQCEILLYKSGFMVGYDSTSPVGQWADGMVSSNCQHVTTKGHLETESGDNRQVHMGLSWLVIESPPKVTSFSRLGSELCSTKGNRLRERGSIMNSLVSLCCGLWRWSWFPLPWFPVISDCRVCLHLVELAFLHLENCHEKNMLAVSCLSQNNKKLHSRLELNPPGGKFSSHKPPTTSKHVSLKEIIAFICLWVWGDLLYSNSWLVHIHSLIKLGREGKGR